MKRCPYCAEEIQDDAIICRFCNHKVGVQKKTVSPVRTSVIILFVGVVVVSAVYLSANGFWGKFFFVDPTNTPTSTFQAIYVDEVCVFEQSGFTFQVITKNAEMGSGKCKFDDSLLASLSGFSSSVLDTKTKKMCSYDFGENSISIYEYRNVGNSPAQAICNWIAGLPGYAIISDERIAQEIMVLEGKGNLAGSTSPTKNSSKNQPPTSCVLWSSVSLSDVGKTMCVYGTVRRTWFSEQQWTQYFTFSSDPQAIYFQKFMYVFDPGLDGKCIQFTGEILQSYQTPYMDLLPDEAIYLCD